MVAVFLYTRGVGVIPQKEHRFSRKDIHHEAGIYAIVNAVSGKSYIGSACNLAERRCRHFVNLRNVRHPNVHLQAAWSFYGADAFTFKILFYCAKSDLLFYEQRALDYYGLKKLYNFCPVASSRLGTVVSDETRQKLWHSPERRAKISKALKAAFSDPEVRARVNEATKRGQSDPDVRRRMSEAAKRRCTPEWIERMRQLSTGRQDSLETREKRRRSALGRAPVKQSTRDKLRALKLGKPRSEETKRKVSEGLRMRHARLQKETLNAS